MLEWLSPQLGRPIPEIEALMHIGAIYLDQVRLDADQRTLDGQTLRIHLEPKRYPKAIIDWSTRIVHREREFIIISKPAKVPIHATLDNKIENALYQVSALLGEQLYPTHRLDVGTSGLCVLGRKADFQKAFHRILKSNETLKVYHALTEAAPPVGHHRHYMEVQKQAPQPIFADNNGTRKLCELEVMSSEKVADAYLTEIKTYTGRTHQIRAQMGFLNCPLVGDQLYGAKQAGDFKLHASQLKFRFDGTLYNFTELPEWLKQRH